MIYIFDSNGYKEIDATKRQARLDVESWNQDHPDDPRDVVECDNPDLYKFVDGKATIKTWDEQVADGLVSQDEINEKERQEILSQLAETDRDMPRGTEDLFDMLVVAGVLTQKQMPKEFVDRIKRKRELRIQL